MEEDLQGHRVNKLLNQNSCLGTSVVVQRLRLHLPMQGVCSIPHWGAKLSHAGTKSENINNRSSIVTNSTKTLKMVHVEKNVK